MADEPRDAASLTAALLSEEEKRLAIQHGVASDAEQQSLAAQLQGEVMPLREALSIGGKGLLGVLTGLAIVDELPRVAALVLAPDIQATFGISDTALLGMLGLVGVALVLTTLPAASLGDRVRRSRVIAWGTMVLVVATVLAALAPNPFLMGVALALGGVGVGSRMPNAASLLADGYPLASRSRVFAIEGSGRPVGQLLGPLLVAGLAAFFTGPESWRWVLALVAIPLLGFGLASFTLRDPTRGQFEQRAVLGDVMETDEPPVTLSAAFARLKKVRSFYLLAVGVGVLGFALVSVPGLMSLLLEDDYGYSSTSRGWMLALSWTASIIAIPIAGIVGERMMAKHPPRLLKLAGVLLLGYGASIVLALRFHQPALLIGGYALANGFQSAAFVATAPPIAAVVPPRMRSQAFALVGLYVFLVGGFFGNLIAGAMSDSWGQRTALTVIVPPAAIIGAAFLLVSSRWITHDTALVVAELQEEHAERLRIATGAEVPVVQVNDLDASYGRVQVLFDCHLSVMKGETLALVGTNGAGKSTMLRAIAGLTAPDRGVVRFHGRTITYSETEYRFRSGIVLVRGGDGVFPSLSVRENLELSLTSLGLDRAEERVRVDRTLELFRPIETRREQLAGSLSGGQRQMLALARALVHEPELLLIDELSLGLAPVVVQDLIVVVNRLRDNGQTMIIVEQSLNIALSISDRIVHMEKGRVVFEGSADEARSGDQLLESLFIGGPATT